MKNILFSFLGLIVMWLMIVLTTMQSDTILWLILAIATFILFYFICKLIKVPIILSFGLQFNKGWLKCLIMGIFIGSCYSIIRFSIFFYAGGIKVVDLFPTDAIALVVPIITLLISISYIAFAEEIVFRGYIFSILPSSLHKNIMIGISAVLFLLGHSLNGITSIARVMELLFAGFTFAIIYLETKSLWPVIGLHFAWDFFWSFLGGDGQASSNYIVTVQKTPVFTEVMGWTDFLLPIILFFSVFILKGILFKPSSKVISSDL